MLVRAQVRDSCCTSYLLLQCLFALCHIAKVIYTLPFSNMEIAHIQGFRAERSKLTNVLASPFL